MYTYVHGGDIYTEKLTKDGKPFVDFSANINPLGLPDGVKKAIKNSLKMCINYPDPFCRELAEKTAEYLGVNSSYLFFGNGAADVLFRLALALKPKKALLLAPTFADYEKSLRSVDCAVKYYDLKEDRNFVIQRDILKKITASTDIVYICNPNNPTGQLIDQKLLEDILKQCAEVNAYLLVDECFVDFVTAERAYSMRSLLSEYKNLIILKAFTKTFAMPGIRLGYCMTSDEKLHRRLHECGQDWSVSTIAQEAGKAALLEKEYLNASMMLISEERNYLVSQLEALGAKVYGAEANYIFFRMEHPQNLKELLHEQGYLIRSCSNYNNLDDKYYRIAIKTRVLNRGLIKAIKEAKKNALIIGTY